LSSFDEVKGNIKTLSLYSEMMALKIEKALGCKDVAALKKLGEESKRTKLAEHCGSDAKILAVLAEAQGVLELLYIYFY
jgi:hypothetical protein